MLFLNLNLKNLFEPKADMNGDGLIDMNEFVNVMLRTNLYDLKQK